MTNAEKAPFSRIFVNGVDYIDLSHETSRKFASLNGNIVEYCRMRSVDDVVELAKKSRYFPKVHECGAAGNPIYHYIVFYEPMAYFVYDAGRCAEYFDAAGEAQRCVKPHGDFSFSVNDFRMRPDTGEVLFMNMFPHLGDGWLPDYCKPAFACAVLLVNFKHREAMRRWFLNNIEEFKKNIQVHPDYSLRCENDPLKRNLIDNLNIRTLFDMYILRRIVHITGPAADMAELYGRVRLGDGVDYADFLRAFYIEAGIAKDDIIEELEKRVDWKF